MIGAGIQGTTDFERLDKVFDCYLVLESDIGFCEGLGSRAWLRILNQGALWRDPIAWAEHCIDVFAKVYPFGTRVMIPLNEPNLALEGGGETEQDYIFLGGWWERFLPAARRKLAAKKMADVLIGGPALSPGHRETDQGGYNKHLLSCYKGVDIIISHYYWYPGGGFLNDADAAYYSKRLEMDMAYIKSLGVPDKPWAVTEFNREVNLTHGPDIENYISQVEQYYDYLEAKGITGFIFLATNSDSSFDKLSLSHMGDAIEKLAQWKANRKPPEVRKVNYTPGRNMPVTNIVVHHTGMGSSNTPPTPVRVASWFDGAEVSSHGIIGTDGRYLAYVKKTDTAWGAAGVDANGNDVSDINDNSIHYELCGDGNIQPFTDPQYTTLVVQINEDRKNFPIKHIYGHQELTVGKVDPGKYFDWGRLKAMLDLTNNSAVVPDDWKQYGKTWEEVAANLLGVAQFTDQKMKKVKAYINEELKDY